MPYFDDVRVGDRMELGSHHFSAEAIVAFARKFDPQAFHLDEEAGRKSLFGGLAASGWHTAAVWMKLMVAARARENAARVARGDKPVVAGPSPGFRDLRWIKPVLADDTIAYVSEIKSLRESASRPQWGLVEMLSTGTNQRGELVYSFAGTVFLPRKPIPRNEESQPRV
jgi:acyl dehydratase